MLKLHEYAVVSSVVCRRWGERRFYSWLSRFRSSERRRRLENIWLAADDKGGPHLRDRCLLCLRSVLRFGQIFRTFGCSDHQQIGLPQCVGYVLLSLDWDLFLFSHRFINIDPFSDLDSVRLKILNKAA